MNSDFEFNSRDRSDREGFEKNLYKKGNRTEKESEIRYLFKHQNSHLESLLKVDYNFHQK